MMTNSLNNECYQREIFYDKEGGGGEMKILRGGSENCKTPERVALKKLGGLQKFVYFKTNRRGVGGEGGGGRVPKKMNR